MELCYLCLSYVILRAAAISKSIKIGLSTYILSSKIILKKTPATF
jgi:hypothetical protein